LLSTRVPIKQRSLCTKIGFAKYNQAQQQNAIGEIQKAIGEEMTTAVKAGSG
jgi:hypothetical protein